MARYRVPDHLICLGQGGVEVGKTFMEQDWILEEVLRDDPRDDAPDEDQQPLHAFFIDTDDSTLPRGMDKNVERRVDRIESEYDLVNAPDVDATTINVASGPHERYLTAERVVGETTINELAASQGLEAWWLQRGNSDILGPLDGLTRGGVDRKRGLTKAISRISEWKSDPLSDVEQSIEGQNDSMVAIVVGLGGGTGSGLFLDLARRIKEAGATVTLFGVLPTPSGRDDDDVLANAYAALSELEYLALSKENYFRNILLLPYDLSIDDDIFDKAATYTITSYYNLSGDQTNTFGKMDETDDQVGPPTYAPFTIASTGYLHYLKEDVDRTKRNFDSYFEAKATALDAEGDLYDKLQTYLTEHHPDAAEELYTTGGTPSFRLPSEDADDLGSRLASVKRLLDKDFMAEMEFRSAAKLSETFEQVESASENQATWEDEQNRDAAITRELITRLPNSIDNPDDYQPDDGEWAAGEREFVQQVITEFELVARRAGIIKAREALESDHGEIATDVGKAISEDDYGHAAEVESEIRSLEAEESTLTDETDAFDTLIEAGTACVTDHSETWGDEAADPVEDYYSLFEQKSKIDGLLDELKDAIDREIDLGDVREADNILISGTEFEDYGTLNSLLRDAGCDPVDEGTIEATVKEVKKARQKQLRAREVDGTVTESILSLLGRGRIGGLRSDYSGARQQDIDSRIVRMPAWNEEFDPTVKSDYFNDRASSLQTREDDLLDDIRAATKRVLDDAADERTDSQQFLSDVDPDDEVESVLDAFDFDGVDADPSDVIDHLDPDEHDTITDATTGSGLVTRLRDGPVDALLSGILVTPFEDRKSELEEQLSETRADLAVYQQLATAVTDEGGTYASAADRVDSIDSIATFEEGGHSGPLREDAEPYSRGKLGNTDHLGDAELWSGKEREQLLEHLNDGGLTPEFGGGHMPINDIYVADEETAREVYDDYRLSTAFMSPLFETFDDDVSADIPDITDELIDQRVMMKDDMLTSRGAFADDYDFVMTTFLTGVFLDNLTVFTNECREAYRSGTDIVAGDSRHNSQTEVPSIVKNHNYGLDGVIYHDDVQFLPPGSDGGFCYRRDLMNFETDGTETLLDHHEDPTENESGVVNALLKDHYEIVGYPSTIDLD